MTERLAAGKAACVGTKVHLLDRSMVVLAGVRFVGAILWTDYDLFGDAGFAMDSCRRWLNDHRLVEVGPPRSRRLFRPEDALALHVRDRAYIEAELSRPFAGPTLVVTHHGPHRGSIAPRYARHPTTAAFVSDLAELIRDGRPDLWVHGHVHTGFDYRVGDTRIVANPKGYGPRSRGRSPENEAFDPGMVVEVSNNGGDRSREGWPSIVSTPETIEVACWTLVQVRDGGDTHVLGYRVANLRGRTSSPVQAFDPATRTATTASGNRYVLVGDPSEDGLDDPAVLAWLAAQDLARQDVESIDLDALCLPPKSIPRI